MASRIFSRQSRLACNYSELKAIRGTVTSVLSYRVALIGAPPVRGKGWSHPMQ